MLAEFIAKPRCQDKIDDRRIGIYSPALFFGQWTIKLCNITGLGFLSLLCYAAYLNNHGSVFYSSLGVSAVMLFRKLWQTDIDTPGSCNAFFQYNVPIAQIILIGLVLDVLVKQ